jgi:hypothetical protein
MDRRRQPKTLNWFTGLMLIALLLDGCSGAAITSNSPAGQSSSSPPPSASTPSDALIHIAGTPATEVTAGTAYSFQPAVSEATSSITFSITGQPAWASFSTTTGALTGTPTAAELGTTGEITITASDSSSTASLTPFAIEVKAASPTGTGSATLTWAAPTHNTDGSPVTGLVGYHIYYGTNQSDPTQSINVSGPTSTTYTVEGLTPGTYYFTVVAYNSSGVDSPDSNVAVKTI